ncbi:MAG: hypothetical protein M3R46_00890 [Actinomycetota bacterium]|nr:hypothetical protein [Actinomycetota bacterium]
MSRTLNYVYDTIDDVHKDKSAHTRRSMIAGTTALLGTMGLLAWSEEADAAHATVPAGTSEPNTPQTILNIAATAEVLATIVNTVGAERVQLSGLERQNVESAAFEEKIHYQVLVSDDVGGEALTKRIWVPDAVFASRSGLFGTLAVGDQVFINAYLLATTVFARGGTGIQSRYARFAAEFMGVEAVHRALAIQALSGNTTTGNDRAFMKFSQTEQATTVPNTGAPGFTRIDAAVEQLQGAGFGFGEEGASPGAFYEYDEVSARTPEPSVVNTRTPA